MANNENQTTTPTVMTIEQPSGLRMVLVMGGIGLVCGVLIVLTYQMTLPIINANKALALQKAIFEVVPAARTKTVYKQVGDRLERLEGEDETAIKYYAGYVDGRLVGVVMEAAGQGFQDIVRFLYGYSPESKCVVGLKILESKETPGLGTKIETDANFQANFDALLIEMAKDGKTIANPVILVKPGKKTDPWQIEAITGATISSQAVATIMEKSTAERIPIIEKNLDLLKNGAP